MINKRRLLGGGIVLCLIFLAPSAHGLTKGFEALSFRPTSDFGPYYTIWGSETFNRWKWTAGTYVTYGYHQFQITQDGTGVRGVLDHTLVQDFYGSIGLIDKWLQAGVELPVGWWVRYTNPNVADSRAQDKQAVGDLQIHFKTKILDADDHRIGLAALPFISLPTGHGKYYFGNGNVAGGAKVIAEVKPVQRIRLAANVGLYFRERFDSGNVENSHQLMYGLGGAAGITKDVSVIVEVGGKTRLSGPFSEKAETPVELIAGLKYRVANSGVTISAGGGDGLLWGTGVPRYRGFLGVNYQPPPAVPAPPPPPEPPLELITNTVIYFPMNGLEITEESAVALGKIADVLNAAPSVKIEILGYSDETGGKNLNRIVSEKRAEKVKWYLNLRGVDAMRMETVGLGEKEPRGDNRTSKGRALNRRVEFTVIKK